MRRTYDTEEAILTKKGLVINFFEKDGGITLRSVWNRKENILIAKKDYTPELLFTVVENFRKMREGQNISNIYMK